ncbi:MAG: carbohydrate binding domain-containing protein [Lutimonas sp.]
MKQFLKQAIKYLFLILAVAVLGCDDDDETNFPQVEAGFTYTLNENSGTVTFINISSEARTYLWTFGDGGTSTEINPIKTFANGTYKVNLKATSVSGASATFEDTIIISIPNPITLPVTFDEPNVNYSVASFNGASFDIVDNPDVSGSNDKASKVGAITNSGAAFEGINFDLGTQLDLTTDKTIQMNFWSDSPVDVLLKLEQGTGPDIEVTTGHGGTGWELISFDFNSSNKYVRMTIFVDGPGTKAGTFYIDDIAQIETPPKPCEEETTQSFDAADFNLTFQTDPGDKISSFDAALTTVQNPDTDNLVNNSCQVGQIDRNGGALFANNQIDFNEKFDFNNNSGFKMKVWSPVAGTNVLVKLEDKTNSNINTEIGAKTTTANAWEELTFDFSSEQSGKYDKIIFFFELNTNTTQTYFIDDFKLYKSDDGGGADCTAETVESISAADLNMTFLTDQTPNFIEDGADFEWIDNPDVANSVNSSCKVGQITKLGNNPWDNNQFDLDGKLDFNANDGLKIKVWSARANTEVRIKLEEIGNPGNNTEQFLITSVTSGWEELTFPFAAENSNKFNKIVIFFDLNANNTDTYYFDDLKLYSDGGGSPDCTPPVGDLVADGGFESGADTCWSLFQNGGTAALDNTTNNGGSWSGKLATNGPSNPAFKQERIGVGTVSAGDVVQIKFDHLGSVVQPGAVFNVLLFGEGSNGASFTHVFNPAPALSDSWTTFTGTFTIPAGTDVSSGISFLIEAVCGGDAGCSVSANIDNVSVILNP